jgi:hypothetical protein
MRLLIAGRFDIDDRARADRLRFAVEFDNAPPGGSIRGTSLKSLRTGAFSPGGLVRPPAGQPGSDGGWIRSIGRRIDMAQDRFIRLADAPKCSG